jgi:lipopolysaccharide transport system permease protein
MANIIHQAVNPHAQLPTSLSEMFASLWRHRTLIWKMARREVIGRYRGSFMGLAWSFFNPVMMLIVYTLVFSGVFKARWGVGVGESKSDFAVILFIGMIIHGLFSECANRAPGLILSNANYVKKVVFPLEILPWVAMASTLFHTLISLIVLMVALVMIHGSISWTGLSLPIVILPLVIGTMGMTWFLAATGVFVRDVNQTIGILTTVMLFLSPVFYPISAIPDAYRSLLYINPLTFIIEESRHVLIWGKLPNFEGLAIYYMLSLLFAWLGFWWFQKTRKGFADVI